MPESRTRLVTNLSLTVFAATFIACLMLFPGVAEARKAKKPKLTIVKPSETFSMDIDIKVGKKQFTEAVACYKNKPGSLSQTKRGLAFKSYEDTLKELAKKGKQKSLAYKKAEKLKKQGAANCKNPQFLALEKYTGPFRAQEARILFERFAFAASPAQIEQAVQRGLDATIEDLTTFRDSFAMDAQFADIMCDTYLANNPWTNEADNRNETCNPYNMNDFRRDGMRKALLWRFTYSQNPFFDRFWFWIHDERLATNSSVLDGNEYHALRTYVQMLDSAARTGDYKQYMRAANTDHFLALDWLDGARNRGFSPNENWAREFWELGTVGAANLDGKPNYTSGDIANAALAHSGWTFVSEKREIPGEQNDVWFRYASYTPSFHSPIAKTIFYGTPYQAVVYDADDVLEATFNHPRTAESLAEDLCRQYLRPDCPAVLVKRIAAEIRKENYQLIPVFKKLMKSRALYDSENRKALIKHPIELLIGFVRQTGMRLTVDELDYWLGQLEQRPLDAATVFGWNERILAGESYVLAWRNVVLDIANGLGKEALQEQRGQNMHDLFLAGNPTSLETIDRVSSMLSVNVNGAQRASLDQYLNFYRTECQYWHVNERGCTEGEMFLLRDPFDSYPTGDWESKLQGLIAILAMQPEYRLK
jgi:uncharacterized protein (DUF1800 family)